MRKDKRWMQIRYNMGVCQNYLFPRLPSTRDRTKASIHINI